MRVQPSISRNVKQPDLCSVLNVNCRSDFVKAANSNTIYGVCLVLHDPEVVLVLVRVKSDLLLLASSRVHMIVGVEITTLGVPMPNANPGAKGDVGRGISHRLAVECGLELAGHKSITITRVHQAEEVDGKHGHVESNGNDDKAECSGTEVLAPDTLY